MTLSDVLFDTGRATLKPGADRDLDRLATALKHNPNMRVMIEGHTDSVGSDDSTKHCRSGAPKRSSCPR